MCIYSMPLAQNILYIGKSGQVGQAAVESTAGGNLRPGVTEIRPLSFGKQG